MINILETIIIVFTIIVCTVLIMTTQQNKPQVYEISKHTYKHKTHHTPGSCDMSCKSIDPVSDPKYNMQQIVKQSILLEEHLTNKNKRCRDCITKHFLHIIGLAEEAEMLATNKIKDYPLITESVALYGLLFQLWIKNYNTDPKADESYILECTNKLRDHRKKLIVIYFFDEKYKLDKMNKDN